MILIMITTINPLAIGNALQVVFVPPDGTQLTRVLRKDADTFIGPADPAAHLVIDTDGNGALDAFNLVNGQTYFYRAYYFNGTVWTASATVSAMPAASYFDRTVDVQTLVRDRIELGIKVEVARAFLKPASGKIDVLTAPPLFDDKRLPMITVHLENENPQQRGIGEVLYADDIDVETGNITSSNGWMGRTQLTIVGWALNPDVRLDLRRALRRVLLANFPVFEESGLETIEFSMNDLADFQTYGCPVYQVVCTFSCLFPIDVAHTGAMNAGGVASSGSVM